MVQFRKDKPTPWIVQIRDARGKLKTSSFLTKKDAEEFEYREKRRRQLIKRGMMAPSEDLLTIDFAAKWMRTRSKQRTGGTTGADGQRLKKYVLPTIGTTPLAYVTTQDVRELLDTAQTEFKLSNATRNRIRAVLHTLFKAAFEEERIMMNPVSRVKLLKESPAKKKPLEKSEIEALISKSYERDRVQGFATVVMLYQGVRVSEVCGLQNQDFDLNSNTLTLSRIYEQSSGTIFERTKGGDGVVIPLFPRVKQAYLEHLRETEFKRPSDFCVHTDSGKPRGTYSVRERMRNDARLANIRRVSPHVLRATFATLAEEAGFSKEDVQRMLNHSTVLVTERYVKRSAQPLLEKGEALGFGAVEGNVVEIKKGKGK